MLSPLELHEIGEAAKRAASVRVDRRPWAGVSPDGYPPQSRDVDVGDALLSELGRRGYRVVREGER